MIVLCDCEFNVIGICVFCDCDYVIVMCDCEFDVIGICVCGV